jgi:O-antigen ligase
MLAVTLNGFWVYLGLLDVVGVEPFAALTGAYYLAVALALLISVWLHRRLVGQRLLERGRLCLIWAVAAGSLAVWLLTSAVFRSHGPVARDAALLLVLASLPSALAVMGLDLASLHRFAVGVTALGLGLAAVDASVLLLDHGRAVRFSPISELNPISAAQTTAFGAVACLALRPSSWRGRALQTAATAALVAATVVPAGRGPLVGLVLALFVIAIVVRRLLPIVVVAAVVGLFVGVLVGGAVGSSSYLRADVPGVPGGSEGPSQGSADSPAATPAVSPISSAAIREYLLRKSLRAVPKAPVLGHGIGSLIDDSPEAQRMIAAGSLDVRDTRTYPHNIVVEAAYSLGLLGLVPLLVCIGAAGIALVRSTLGASGASSTVLVLGVCAVASVGSSLSGELGMDAYVWIALALPVALYAGRGEATASAR